ncbi:MAG: hypothetical protein ACOYXA_14535 [Bacteroidota bacterium]
MKFTDILSLFKQGKASAKSHMKNLIEMAAVDGNFDSIEYDLLKSIAKRNSISESQLEAIRKKPEGVEFVVPESKEERFHQLYDLVHMMTIDKSVHDEELKLCNLFAVKFGYQREKVRDIIEAIRQNIQNGQSHNEAMKRLSLLLD